jgi:hypothetical protein
MQMITGAAASPFVSQLRMLAKPRQNEYLTTKYAGFFRNQAKVFHSLHTTLRELIA